jgi:hypothetical protein
MREKSCVWVLGRWWKIKKQQQQREAETREYRLWADECPKMAESMP